MTVAAVVFDLDGVLIDSEERWDVARRTVVRDAGGAWREEATTAMQGMSAPEWAAYLADALGAEGSPDELSHAVVGEMADGYRRDLPLLDGAVEAVRALASRWPLAVASSANAVLIALALDLAGIDDAFAATVSSQEVARGKPAPDVYLEAARRLDVDAVRCVAIEDSSNGLRSAAAAGMAVVAVPNPTYPPAPDSLALARARVASVRDVTPELVAGLIEE